MGKGQKEEVTKRHSRNFWFMSMFIVLTVLILPQIYMYSIYML